LYTCIQCGIKYNNFKQYLFHCRYVHAPLVYACNLCNRRFKSIKQLLEHDQLIHAKTLNYCEICLEPNKSRASLYEHYKKAHLRKCPTTSIDVTSEQQRQQQQQQQLTYIRLIEDAENEQLTNTSSSMRRQSIEEDTGRHELLELDSISELESSINKAKSSTITTPNKRIEDDPNNGLNGRVHKNDLIRGLLDRKHQCKWCSLRFYTKSQLKAHETEHINTYLYCPVCDKEFTHKDRLSGHMKCHMEPSLECKVCGKKFKRLCNLYNHELVHGLTEHAFMLCQFCGRGFRSRRDYQNHVIANHRAALMKTDATSSTNASSVSENSCNENASAAYDQLDASVTE
jgi:uncharacterized C2H2 Zn-finger protein